jgi:hypothetical protein
MRTVNAPVRQAQRVTCDEQQIGAGGVGSGSCAWISVRLNDCTTSGTPASVKVGRYVAELTTLDEQHAVLGVGAVHDEWGGGRRVRGTREHREANDGCGQEQ